jgi:ubiquinone/menaquinone biosynthesis C-methylase UbiE
MDHYSKFSPKAQIYDQYRWDFHPEAITEMCEITGINQDSVVADIGSGTGMLTAHFVHKVNKIYAIEPNPEMRTIAIDKLAQYPAFVSIDGLSDNTKLPAHSVDLIVVGRAIHWFNPHTTKAEFLRILKPDGWFAICQIPYEDLELLEAVKTLRKPEYGWNVTEDKSRIIENNDLDSYYFKNNDYQIIKHGSVVTENWENFLGRITSFSPSPDSDNPLFHKFETEAKKIFDRYSEKGILRINISTEIKLGKIG